MLSNVCFGQNIQNRGIEPNAANWKTFVITSGKAIPIPPPPGKQASQAELKEIISIQRKKDSTTVNEIHYWNAGPPVYRWQKIADNLFDTAQYWVRVYAYMNAAIYDATIAAWKAKYTYNRIRPSEASGDIKNLVLLPLSPSYPCEHSVTAGAVVLY